MARIRAAWLTGTRPACQQAPSMTMLLGMVSPSRRCAMPWASKVCSLPSGPTANFIFSSSSPACRLASGLRTKAAVGSSCVLAKMTVRPGFTVCSASWLAPTTRSQASSTSACWVSMRTWFSRSAVGATRTKLSTLPPFCAKPMKSSTEACLRSRCAAMVIRAPTVTTPVPPTPVTSRSKGPVQVHAGGSPMAASSRCTSAGVKLAPTFFFSTAPSTLTKLGQKPLTQLKSLLQLVCSMARLRPKSVSTGTTLRQLLAWPQSPQPSHTCSLMKMRRGGSANSFFLRRRRFSAAQVWS